MRKASPASAQDFPPVEFWEDKLELRAADLLAASHAPGFIEQWLERRSSAQISMLRALVGLPISANRKGRAADLLRYLDELRRFVPVAVFGFRRSMLATLEVAEKCVREELRQLATIGDGVYDTTALLFAIFDHSQEELERVFFLDMLHRVGLARMKLRRVPRHPGRSLLGFLCSNGLMAVLEDFDQAQRDGRHCKMRGVLDREGGCLVFIRRPLKESCLLVNNRVVHGHTADWIVLEFRNEGRLLNVASHGRNASFAIANRIASAFYGQPCEYVNVDEVTYPAQLQAFLERLATDKALELIMVAVGLHELPLPGFSQLEGSNTENVSVGPGILALQEGLKVPLLRGEHVESLKVLYKDKRVLIKIDKAHGSTPDEPRYVIRYGDQRLNLGERQEFEALIEREHGFKIVSTEKRRVKS